VTERGTAPAAPTLEATVEVANWVSKYVGGDGARSRVLRESFRPGETVRDLLRRCSSRFPDLDAALWEPGGAALGAHIEVLVNDAVLGVAHDLDTPLAGGERITLLGQFMGG
jgi:molybdopterin converting factor small subunit